MYWDIYLSLVIGGILQFYQIEIYSVLSAINILLTFMIFSFVLASPFGFWLIINKNKSHLEDESTRSKWGMLYESLKIEETVKIHPIKYPNTMVRKANI